MANKDNKDTTLDYVMGQVSGLKMTYLLIIVSSRNEEQRGQIANLVANVREDLLQDFKEGQWPDYARGLDDCLAQLAREIAPAPASPPAVEVS